MDLSIQIALIVLVAVIVITLIVGVILSTIGIFKLRGTVKTRNRILLQSTRPYIICQKNKHHLEIRNVGKTPAKIDDITTISKVDLNYLKNRTVFSGQTFIYAIEESEKFSITIKYHDEVNHYSDNFTL